MRTVKNRFIAICQLGLALGVVLALVVPAASVLTLDVVSPSPSAHEYEVRLDESTAEVPAAPVDPKVEEYALEVEAPAGPKKPKAAQQRAGAGGQGRTRSGGHDSEEHDSHEDHAHDGHSHGLPEDIDPEDVVKASVTAPVDGFGAVGVTWSAETPVADDEVAVQVRTRNGDEWSDWDDVVFHDDHAPDPDSPDAATARGGTDAVIVGDVDEVEVRVDGAGVLPEDIQLAVVNPGEADEVREEGPELETTIGQATETIGDSGEAEDGSLELRNRRTSAPRPTIYSRAQWGADERIRNARSLRYGSISGGFVHHTVNANNYTQAQVPGIIRSIYAYHVRSRGWSDIGYNFLVDRFGRIWEGRHGGVDKAVVGAHTLGYNESSFAMSAIGNFETAVPTKAVIDAYAALMAWKLGLHGVSATATNQRIGRGTFAAISGHRDAGSTACPGRHLYSRLGDIRRQAGSLQGTGGGVNNYSHPSPDSDLIGSPHPDIVARRASDGRFFVFPTEGMTRFKAPKAVQNGWRNPQNVFVSPDLTGDGIPDLVRVRPQGALEIRAGDGKGAFARNGRVVRATRNHTLVTSLGDLNGDGRNDLVGRGPQGRAVAFLQQPGGGFKRQQLGRSWRSLDTLVGVGDQTGDGRPDLIARNNAGRVLFIPATGPKSMGAPRSTSGIAQQPDIAGGQDFTGDGRADLLVRARGGRLFVLPSLGNGSFGPQIGPLGHRPGLDSLSVGPVNGTGHPDLVARRGGDLVVLGHAGTYELGQPVNAGFRMPHGRAVVNVGDWDGDGHGDIISVRANGFLQLRRGDGKGNFAPPQRIGRGYQQVKQLQAVGDINGDGRPDLIGEVNGVLTFFGGGSNGGVGPAAQGVPAPSIGGVLSRSDKVGSYDPARLDWRIIVGDAGFAKGGQALRTDLVARERGTGHVFLYKGTVNGPGQRRFLGTLKGYDLAG